LWGAAAAFIATTHAALPAASGDADNSPCSPTRVLYEIDHRNRGRLEKILHDASLVANSDAVLWRIDKPGVPASFLFGTVHVIDPSLQALSQSTLAAIDAAKVVAVEAAETSRKSLTNSMAQAQPLMVSTDRELQRILAADELAIVEKVLADAGYPAQLALGLKPWAATMFLADSPCQRKLQDRGLKPIDTLVSERAEANRTEVVGLETTYEQYRSLASIPLELQAAWLKTSIELNPRVDDISQTMSELYRFRRMDAAWTLTQEMAQTSSLDDATLKSLRNELVGKRNARMLERALPLLDRGSVFIAVGAMHQIGSDGLVALLRQKGFTLTPIE
jgi:uncharacterized protein YbaP (TraB family)